MLSFFRRVINSKVGVILGLVFLGVIALSFAATDVQNMGLSLGGVGSGEVAEVDGEGIPVSELAERVDQQYRELAQQRPGLDRAAFINAGGVDDTLNRLVNSVVLREFAGRHGIAASERLVEGRIAGLPGFRGPSGKFDETTFRRVLAENNVTEAQIRDDIAREALARQLLDPVIGANQVSERVARPYADLLLERRSGVFGVIPADAFPQGAPPTAQEIQAYYARNIARFTVPERRVIRYATFGPDKVAAAAVPTDAEIAAEYNRNRATYAARESRDLTQLILADQAAANRIATAVRGGQSLQAAAQAAGLASTALPKVEKAGLAAAASPAVADAAFAAAQGGVAGPVRSQLGWHVFRVDAITAIPARTLEQARGEIAERLTATKREAAIAELVANIEDAAAEGTGMADLARRFGLQAAVSAPLTSQGLNPDQPTDQPPLPLQAVLQAAFQGEPGDEPAVATLPGNAGYVLWDLDSVVPSAPRPLAQVRDAAQAGVIRDRQLRAAREAARNVVAKVNGGQPLEAALRSIGVPTPPVERASGTRAEFSQGRGQVPPPVALMFSMAQKRAKQLDAPNRAGFIIVYLDAIQKGDAGKDPRVIAATRQGLSGAVGAEYAAQFVRAIRQELNVKINDKAVAEAKRSIAGGNAPTP